MGWQQDRSPTGGARGVGGAWTKDGGETWHRFVLPSLSQCTGGPWLRATDPWLGFGHNGVAYFATLAFDDTGKRSSVVVSRSIDGGETWSAPILVADDEQVFFNDKEALTVDPFEPNNAYLVWTKSSSVLVAYFSRTTDGGRTWSEPQPIHVPGGAGNQITVLGDGSLVNVYTNLFAGQRRLMATRSLDKGRTWLLPIPAARMSGDEGPVDPYSGRSVRAGGLLPSVASGPDGRVWVSWAEDTKVLVTSSTDGISWTPPLVAAIGDAAMFTPSVGVRADGTVGISYYDWRNNGSEDAILTDLWIATSRDDGTTWEEQHVAGPFDLQRAPYVEERGYFLGDYHALVGTGSDFVALNAMASTADQPYTDVYAFRVHDGP